MAGSRAYYIPPPPPKSICNTVQLAITENINSTSTPSTRLRYSCLNWHVTTLFELYLCSVAGHDSAIYIFQRNPITSIKRLNFWPNYLPIPTQPQFCRWSSTKYLEEIHSIKLKLLSNIFPFYRSFRNYYFYPN